MQYKLSIRLLGTLTVITVSVMAVFIGLRYYLLSEKLRLELEHRAMEVAERVAESVTPSILSTHRGNEETRFSSSVASAILDAEMASDLVIAISVFSNFGQLYAGRFKRADGELAAVDRLLNMQMASLHPYRIQQPIHKGAMTIGTVEVIYNIDSIQPALHSALVLEVLQAAVVSMLFIGLLYWALRESLILPMETLQVARQTLDSIQEGVVLTDRDFRIIDINAAFETLTGFSKDEVVGQRPPIRHCDRSSKSTIWKELRANSCWSGEVVVGRRAKLSFPAWLSFNEVWHADKLVCHVGVLRDISDKKEAELQLQRMAYFDALTALPNRSRFLQSLDHEIQVASRHKRALGLLFIDLDNFKWVNDNFGHEIGDRYLESVAKKIQNRIRKTDVVFRLGGDEFTTIVSDFSNETSLEILAKDLIEIISQPVEIERCRISAGASIGIALYPRDADDAEQLIKHADTAMYQAKELGRNNSVFFSSELEQKKRNARQMDEALRRAIAGDELVLYFQPKVQYQTQLEENGGRERNIVSSQVQGAEVLLRWFRPGHDIIEPAAFIPIAEQSDLIVEVGEWVLQAACRQLAAWQGTPLADLSLAVNISARQLNKEDFVERLGRILHQCHADPRKLELEITESAVIENIEQSVSRLKKIKALGVRIAMDDFGTGFSSLSYLKQLPIDVIKIDRSFVNDLPNDDDDVVIVNAIFSMSKAMRINVVAEGIENYAQLQFLLSQGCESSQGFFHSRPLPKADFEHWVSIYKLRIDRALTVAEGKTQGVSPALMGTTVS